jgi:hypothetical protein
MDLVKAPKLTQPFYTPAPEVIQDEPGSALFAEWILSYMEPTDRKKTYLDLLHKMKVALVLPFRFS